MVYTVCIGSNEEREANLALARRRLAEAFPNVCFATEEQTPPLVFHRAGPFSNQLARFSSDWEQCRISSLLKQIEREAGRLPGDKEREIVRLDIDLLACDGQVYKPGDWERDYVVRGVKELDEEQKI